jgi:hypothetical protein
MTEDPGYSYDRRKQKRVREFPRPGSLRHRDYYDKPVHRQKCIVKATGWRC